MAILTTKDTEAYYSADQPQLKYPDVKYAMAKPKFDVVPYRGKKIRGKVVCDGAAIDALKGYGRCRLIDEKGRDVIVAGWVVDLDPTKKEFWEPKPFTHQAPVRYEFCFRKDALDEVKIEITEVSQELKNVLDEKGDYVCVSGSVVNPRVFVAENEKYFAGPLVEKIAKEVGL